MKPSDAIVKESEAGNYIWVCGAVLDRWVEGGGSSHSGRLAHWPLFIGNILRREDDKL